MYTHKLKCTHVHKRTHCSTHMFTLLVCSYTHESTQMYTELQFKHKKPCGIKDPQGFDVYIEMNRILSVIIIKLVQMIELSNKSILLFVFTIPFIQMNTK